MNGTKSDIQVRLEEQLRNSMQLNYVQMAQSILEDRGHLVKGSYELTEEGRKRDLLGVEGRALDRSGRGDGVYNPETNRVTKL